MAIQGPDRASAQEKLEGGKVKGVMLSAHVGWVRDEHGENGVRALIGALPEEMRSQVESPLASMWYPFATLIETDRAIAYRFGDGRPEFVRILGRHSARTGLSTTYKLFKRESLREFFSRSAPLHKQFQDFGEVRFEDLGENSVRMIHFDYDCYSPIFCESALGYYEEVVLLHGDRAASIRETECQTLGAEACIFEVEWT